MRINDFVQTIELLKGKRELAAVFQEMRDIINGPNGESPYLPLLFEGFINYTKPENPFFKAVDFHFYKDYAKNSCGNLVDCLSILVESNLSSFHFVNNMNLQATLRSLMTELQAKHNFAPEVDWTDRTKTWIMCGTVSRRAEYYLANISLSQIKAVLMKKYENICEVTSCAGSIVVIFKEPMRSIKKRELLRAEISEQCYDIIKQNDELDFWKAASIIIDFGDKADLDRYIKEYGEEGLSRMAMSNWDYGGCLY